MSMSSIAMEPVAVRDQLRRVLQSKVFERAQRSQKLLEYIVEAALADPPVTVKEYTIALEVFDRDPSYDPAVDATVRVEAGRLRSRLREYYDDEGRDDPWLLEMPKGGYGAVLRPRMPQVVSTPNEAPEPVPDETLLSNSAKGQEVTRAGSWGWVWVLCGLIVLTSGFVAWRMVRRAPVQTAASAPISLAILPIVNRTEEKDLDFAADGLTDDLIRQLSEVPALRMMARTTMFRYRNRVGDAAGVAKALHADVVMTGEFRRTAEHLSLALEMSRSSDQSVLLDREYIIEDHDLRSVQAEVQRDVLSRLHLEDSALVSRGGIHSVTSNAQAYQEFLNADTLARNGDPSDLHQSLRHLERAVALDPKFDLAWADLASEHVLLGTYYEAPREHMPLARQYAERALSINPRLGEAHGSLGLIYLLYDWNLPAAEAEMNTAGAETAAIGTLSCTAHLIEREGQPRAAEEMLERMLSYDPESAALVSELGCVDFYRGDYEAALRHYEAAMKADPRLPSAYWGIGKCMNAQGRHAEAIAVLRGFKQRYGFEPPLLTAEIGYALGASGKRAAALSEIRSLTTRPPGEFVDPYLIAMVYASMNDRDEAFSWLDRALEVRSAFVISLLSEPKWRPFQSDLRFAQLVGRLERGGTK